MRGQDRAGSPWHVLLPLPIIFAGVAVYFNSAAGVFLFDDRGHILGDRRLKSLWPLWEALDRGRPVVDYTLAVNYAIGGEDPRGYHAFNIAVHTLAALLLFGIVRRTLTGGPPSADSVLPQKPCPRRAVGMAPTWLALAAALIWVVHPLHTQSVTYLIQRAESMMGLFYLLTFYCAIRGADSPRRIRWYGGAVVACALGMGSKAVMVTAPVMVLLYGRVFLSKSFIEAFRRGWGLYLGLASTWVCLWATGVATGVLNPSPRVVHVGFGFKGIAPLEYVLTQFGVLLQYLKLSLWPHPLCLDYNWPVARTPSSIVPPMIVIGALVAATLWALRYKPAWGFVGAWFFIILAPTSSFIPIKDPLFEHRMYLSLAAVIVLGVLGGHWVLRHIIASAYGGWLRTATGRGITVVLVVMVITSLGYGTVRRNEDYTSEAAMWQDVRIKRPNNARAAENLGTALLAEGRMEEAVTALREAVCVRPLSADVRNGLGFALVAQGRLDEAMESFQEAVRLRPTFARAHVNLGKAFFTKGQLDRALEHFEKAVLSRPLYANARLELGNALMVKGKVDEAIEQYRGILAFDPRQPKAWGNLGSAFLNKGQFDEASQAFRQALQIEPDSHDTYNNLAIAFAAMKKVDEASAAFRKALQLKPDSAKAHADFAKLLLVTGDLQDAVRHYEAALRIQPLHADAWYELGIALSRQGKIDEAIEQYRRALTIKPDHPDARRALEAARARKERSSIP